MVPFLASNGNGVFFACNPRGIRQDTFIQIKANTAPIKSRPSPLPKFDQHLTPPKDQYPRKVKRHYSDRDPLPRKLRCTCA